MRGFAIAALVGTSASLALLCLLRQKSSAEEEDDDEGDGEVLEPGMILLEFAKEVPDLLPIAFLVHAVVKNIDKEDAAARQFGQGVEALEVLILQATSLPPALLSRLAAALEKAEEAMRSGGQVAGSFAALGVELQACMDALEYDSAALADADFDPKDLFGGAMAAAIDSKRRAQAADEEQVKLLSERNRLLAEQVAQMQAVLSQQQMQQQQMQQQMQQQQQTQTQQPSPPPTPTPTPTQLPLPPAHEPQVSLPTHALTDPSVRLSPREFFSYFPVPPDEAERRQLLQRSCLVQLCAPVQPLEATLRRAVEGGVLGPGLGGLLVTLMAESEQRVLALLCRAADGTWVGSSQIGIANWAPIPRKLTNCQYVVASGEVECVSATSGHRLPDARREALMPSLAHADPAIANALAPGGYVAMLHAHAAKLQAGGVDPDPMLSLALQTVSGHYMGAPVRLKDGCVVGALCGLFNTDAAGGVELEGADVRAALQQQAALVATVLEGVCG